MQAVELKIARIGNSRGVRIPAEVLRRYAFTDVAVMVAGVDGILLRPKMQTAPKMTWTDTAKAMAAASENWSDWDSTASDGLADIPWETLAVAEKHKGYRTAPKPASRRIS